MTPEYMIVNQCLLLLQQADIRMIDKLRIEIRLIQIKRMLLADDSSQRWCNGDSLREVLSEIRKMGTSVCKADAAKSVMACADKILSSAPFKTAGEAFASVE